MDEISCGVCRDLLPLVRDGIAGDESRAAVARHLENCPACRALAGEETPPPADTDPEEAFRKLWRKSRTFSAMVLMFGLVFGLTLTAGSRMFYNSLVMPLAGALGYGVFRWRAAYLVPAMLLVTHVFTNLLGLGGEMLNLWSLALWTGVYCLLALTGTVIAGLLHFALRKERD